MVKIKDLRIDHPKKKQLWVLPVSLDLPLMPFLPALRQERNLPV
jgi:hypothetical protein